MTYLELNALDTKNAKCERCGCTEARACPDGCAWDPFWLTQGRTICTACVTTPGVGGRCRPRKSRRFR